ncbi:SRPBCC family protein [Gordonia sp. CPCC 205515]|uniref:SRPBCC family protein n=1 Tax=Gordonia sp. CPCC 205515 TaxID=3140791 RepID=UPI003AF3C869
MTVRVCAPPDVAFDYLADPANRPRWQSSLRRIDDLRTAGSIRGDVGTAWTDVTAVPGISPRMEVVEADRPRRWREIGQWYFVDASLILDFDGTDDGPTDVRARAWLTVPVMVAPGVLPLRLITPRALAADLRSAADQLASSAP